MKKTPDRALSKHTMMMRPNVLAGRMGPGLAALSMTVWLYGCTGSPTVEFAKLAIRPAPIVFESVEGQRDARARTQLPQELLEHLPSRGVYAAGISSISDSWHIVLDLDQRSLRWMTTAPADLRTDYPVVFEGFARFDDTHVRKLITTADRIWHNHIEPRHPEEPQAHTQSPIYIEVLVFVDGDDVMYREGYGRLWKTTRAAELVQRIRKSTLAP